MRFVCEGESRVLDYNLEYLISFHKVICSLELKWFLCVPHLVTSYTNALNIWLHPLSSPIFILHKNICHLGIG
jgi:hypothetical protein